VFHNKKKFYEQMKERQDVPVNETEILGIDILTDPYFLPFPHNQ
jgi:hypothetical protein